MINIFIVINVQRGKLHLCLFGFGDSFELISMRIKTRERRGEGWSGVEWSGVEWSGVEWSGVRMT
jgi:hypothetical protein